MHYRESEMKLSLLLLYSFTSLQSPYCILVLTGFITIFLNHPLACLSLRAYLIFMLSMKNSRHTLLFQMFSSFLCSVNNWNHTFEAVGAFLSFQFSLIFISDRKLFRHVHPPVFINSQVCKALSKPKKINI